ncbi:MAG: hypothetical protein P8K79_03140 [Mariniblastus sp.]|nr:hypothetical protein [Mariniblastus sp.]
MTKLLLIVVLSVPAMVDDRPPIDWLSGKSLARAKQLAISVRWRDVPVRDRLIQLSQTQGIPVVVDRQVDPNRPLNLDIQQKTWDQVLWGIAEQLDLEICQLEELYYVTPVGSSLPIRIAYDRNKDQLRRTRNRLPVPWLTVTEFEINEFEQPREMVEKLAEQYELSLEGLEKIPHDVWPGYRFPKMDLLQKFTILLSGFGLCPSISENGKTMTIEDIPAIESAKLRIPFTEQPRTAANALAPMFKDLSIKAYSQGVWVEGPITEIVKFQKKLVGMQKAIIGKESKKDFSVTASRGQILATMANQLGVKMVLEAGIRPKLEQQATITMSGVSEEDVIREVLEGTDLTYQLTAEQLKIIRQ